MSKARDIASAAPAPSTVSATELGYVDGVTSAIQTQLDAKTAKSTLTTTGDIYYASAANTPARLGIGTASQLLAVNSGATAPEWVAAPSSGGMTLISETSASALSSLSFTSLGSYKQLLLLWSGIQHSAGASTAFELRLNNDSGSNYSVRQVYSNTTTTQNYSASTNTVGGIYVSTFGYDASNANIQHQSQGWVLIDNYTSTTKFKQITGQWAYSDNGGTGLSNAIYNNTVYGSTSAVTSIDIVRTSGAQTFSNTTNTTIRLYGIS